MRLRKNPIKNPPPEIVARGLVAIQDYFSALFESETSQLFEAKLIIVGEGEVGKTCLACKFVDPDFDIERNREKIASTQGIEIVDWQIETDLTDEFKINIWDFGGQEIYHATHQFFLTKRSLYLFVWDARKEDRLGGFYYWLNVVGLLSDNAPVLIVLNKADERIKEIDQGSLKAKFDNIVGFHKVSALTGRGLPELTHDIKANITSLPHVGDTWPVVWTNVRRTLEEDERDYIDYEEYLDVCREAGLDSSQADLLSTYLHDLGVILHFREDPLLQKIVILKPEWGTNAVYAVLDTREVQERNGRFSFKDLGQIWSENTYPASKHAELLQLMRRFELCFQLGDSQDYIIPELLSAKPPSFTWNGNNDLRFEYHYDFMPAGIITRFIARTNELIEGDLYWRNGVVLSWEGTRALVTSEPLNSKIRVAVVGEDKKGLLSVVRREFAYIHKTLNDPDAKQMIPCICEKCQSGNPSFYEYQRLRKFFARGLKEVPCDNSAEMVSIERLLTGVFSPKEIESAKSGDARTYYIEHYHERSGADVQTPQGSQQPVRSPWSSGSFYLLALVVVFASLGVIASLLPLWILPAIIVGGLLAVSIIGALQLKQDERLPDESFLKLMELSLKQLPLISRVVKADSSDKE